MSKDYTEEYSEKLGIMKESIDHYEAEASKLVGSKCMLKIRMRGGWEQLTGENATYAKSVEGHAFLLTTDKDITVARFTLSELMGCSAICVSSAAYTADNYRGLGINTLLNNFRIQLASFLGYSLMLCTNNSHNLAQRKILSKNGWKDIHQFQNKQNNHIIHLTVTSV